MREREINTAKHFGIFGKMQELENELLNIEGIPEVDFDLDGFWNDMNYVILIPKYSIPVSASNYFTQRKKQLNEILEVCARHDLKTSEDKIEDYGEHWYIVRKCGATWRKA